MLQMLPRTLLDLKTKMVSGDDVNVAIAIIQGWQEVE